MRLNIRHRTHYRFDAPVTFGLQQLRKTPKSGGGQTILSWEVEIEGGRRELSFEDHHRNHVDLVSFDRDATELSVTCQGEVEIAETHGISGAHIGPAPLWLYRRATSLTRAGRGVRALMRELTGDSTLERLHALMGAVREAVRYETGAPHPGWTAEDALNAGHGVCQDHAHVFLAAAREMDLPARYVSGYLRMDGQDEQDAMHAWAEAHVDELGWVGFDPSNGISPDLRYVRVATGLDYTEAAPVTGTRIGGDRESLSVQIRVAQQ